MKAAREVVRSQLPSAGQVDEWIKQRLAEFDEQRRRKQQNGSTATAPDASSNGSQS